LSYLIQELIRTAEIEKTAAANGTKTWYHALNVTNADSVAPVFDIIREKIRHPIRGLVACAGISGECDACDYPIDVFRKIIDVNITGTFTITQAVGREMHRANVTGSVVLIASM
jgi:NAD(P)-dependent dehydrogenase (short-subunit alcohol dehydrogenase family)